MTRAQKTRLRSQFSITFNPTLRVVALVDKSVECGGMTVTNDAENIVQWLSEGALLRDGEHLIYCDTESNWDELLHRGGKFQGFKLLHCRTMTDAAIKAVNGDAGSLQVEAAQEDWHQ